MDTGSAILSFAPAQDPARAAPAASPDRGRDGLDAPLLLALELGEAAARSLPGFAGWQVIALPARELSAAVLARWRPAAVAMPLWSPHTDALQLLQALAALGYAGAVEVLAPPLPDRGMVLRELAQAAPGVTLRLTEAMRPG